MNYLKEPHTALFVGQTNCGKTERALRLLESEYKDFYDFIIIISPTLKWNKTYRNRKWFWLDEYVLAIEPGGKLYEFIEYFSNSLAGYNVLFLIDDIIADETLDKKRQPLLDLAISGRHKGHSLWILTQSYTAIPKNIRRQVKMLYVWYPKDRKDLNVIHDENDVIKTDEELLNVKNQLKQGKHMCLVIRLEFPRKYVVN